MKVSVAILVFIAICCQGPFEASQTYDQNLQKDLRKSHMSIRHESVQGQSQLQIKDANEALERYVSIDNEWEKSPRRRRTDSTSKTNVTNSYYGKRFQHIEADGSANEKIEKMGNGKDIGIKQSHDLEDFGRVRNRRTIRSQANITCTSPLLSCQGRCLQRRDPGGGKKEMRCSCDPYCSYFKDCCYDYVKYCLSGNPVAHDITSKIPDEHWSCRTGIWMVTSCPKSWTNQDVSKSCSTVTKMTHENYADVLPVTTSDNKTYANRFCAQCHGYHENQMEFYQLDFKCPVSPASDGTLKEKMKFIFENCHRSPIVPNIGISRRYCDIWSISKCGHLSSIETRAKCVNGSYGLVYTKQMRITFKNVYCAMCNGWDLTTSKFQCGPGPGPPTEKGDFGIAAKPFSLVLDIGKHSLQQTQAAPLKISCRNGEVYDWYLETCRKGQQFLPVLSNLKRYRVALWMKAIGIMSPTILVIPNAWFVRALAEELMINSTAIVFISLNFLDSNQQLYLLIFDLNLPNDDDEQLRMNVTDLFKLTKSPKRILKIGYVSFYAVKITFKPLTCILADTYSPMEYEIIPGTSSVYINKTGELLNQRDYFSNNTIMVQGHAQPVGNIVVCRQMLSGNCSGTYIFLERQEYVMFPNRSLLFTAASRLYEYGEYTFTNGTVMICTDFTRSYKQYKKETWNDTPLIILTYIGFSISILCLVFVLVIYSLFPTLRTIPGINLMNLSSALLVAHVLWLAGSGLTIPGKGCTAIAVVLHYSFLASFMWMSIMAFDTWRAFSNKSCRSSRNDKQGKRRRIAFTMAIGWIPLVIFLSVFVGLDQSNVVAIRYGGEKGCWINNSWANLYFFAIPVAVSLVWNLVFFSLVVRSIKKVREQSQMVTSQHQARRDSTVYARIAALMGFTWVFGFVAPFTSLYLMYPFVILNTLQGLFIAVAFCFTRRVRLLYHGFYSKRKNISMSHKSKEISDTRL
ncbi:hypothetical protein QZH41_004362 [Actinostola sp. cb2023]|nr:hypothetical protein QZH41_004362 [Actinostola sp. cb2023]